MLALPEEENQGQRPSENLAPHFSAISHYMNITESFLDSVMANQLARTVVC
jgi:hypothetical protein